MFLPRINYHHPRAYFGLEYLMAVKVLEKNREKLFGVVQKAADDFSKVGRVLCRIIRWEKKINLD